MCYNETSRESVVVLSKETQDYVYHAYQETINITKRSFKSFRRPEFGEYAPMYVFTTENLLGYLRKLKVNGKSVLTVTSSADHLINLAFAGASRVDNFDCNRNTYFMAELKLAALQVLTYEEFLDFFTDAKSRVIDYSGFLAGQKRVEENELVFDYKTYLRIRPYLKEDCALYWDLLYEEFSFDGKKLTDSGIVFGGDREAATKNNEYLLDNKHYEKAREAVSKVEKNYYFVDILQIHNLPHTYDLVLLSNIYEYLTDEWYSTITKERFNEYITKDIAPILNEGAKVVAAYQYHYRLKNQAFKPSLKNLFMRGKWELEKRDSLLQIGCRISEFPSVIQEYSADHGKDCIYVYDSGKVR